MKTLRLMTLVTCLGAVPALADIAPPEPTPVAAPPPKPGPAPAPEPAPQHPAGIEKVIPQGVIADGKEYVYGAYLLTFGSFLLYAWSLYSRRPTGPLPSEKSS
jgi:hypothetical protein